MRKLSLLTSLVLALAACDKAEPAATAPTGETATQGAAAGDHAHGDHAHDDHAHGDEAHGDHAHGENAGHDHGDHEHHGDANHRFENAEKWAKMFDDPARDEWQKPGDVIAAMAIEPGMSIADIGAGTGYFLGHLSKAAGEKGQVMGLDIEETMVTYMKKRSSESGWANVSAKKIEATNPGLDAASVDRILIVDTWHHIGEREAYSAELAKALKPDGAVFIVDFNVDSPRGPAAKHKLAPEAVVKELEGGGLKAEIVEESLPDQYIVKAVAK